MEIRGGKGVSEMALGFFPIIFAPISAPLESLLLFKLIVFLRSSMSHSFWSSENDEILSSGDDSVRIYSFVLDGSRLGRGSSYTLFVEASW